MAPVKTQLNRFSNSFLKEVNILYHAYFKTHAFRFDSITYAPKSLKPYGKTS